VRIVTRRVILEEFRHALGNESDDTANYSFPKAWPHDREQRARIIGEWLQAEDYWAHGGSYSHAP